MAYIFDLAVILIFLVAIWIGYRRGFMKAFIRLAGCVLAVIIAGTLSTVLAAGIFDVFIQDKLQESIESKIQSAENESVTGGLELVLKDLPGPVVSILKSRNMGTPDQIMSSVQGNVDNGIEKIASAIVTQVIRPVAIWLLRIICFFVLLIILMFVVNILASIINKIFKLPLLKQMNGALGAVIGAVEGVVLIFVVVTVLQLMAASAKSDAAISTENLDKTILISAISNVNPISDTLQSVMDTFPDR